MSRDETDKKYSELISQCDLLIKAGKIGAVANLISRLNFAQVPRHFRQSLAKLCRRVGLVSQGLQLLHPLIRETKIKLEPPSDGEICEYSVLLSRNGSVQEALNLLSEVDSSRTPEASLYLAYCHIMNWDYPKAIGYLESFLSSSNDEYSKLIARVNLISSYLPVSDFDKASDLLVETIALAEKSGASRLIGNCLELRARIHLQRQEFSQSRDDLNQALGIFGSSQVYDRLFIYKWQSVISALETRSIEPLVQFRKEAIALNQWESVRESDLFMIKVEPNQQMLDHLTFGTPMPFYRQRIQSEVGGHPSLTYILGDRAASCLDLQSGSFDGDAHLNPGKKVHQVIAALVRDFYVPRNMGTLFSELYPNEYFDMNSSPVRVRQLLLRTRKWLHKNGLPAIVEQVKGSYRFQIQGAFGIQIPLESQSLNSRNVQLLKLRAAFPPGTTFSAKQVCNQFEWPRSSFLLFAEAAINAGELEKSGSGRSTVYFWPQPESLRSDRRDPSAA